MLVGQDASRQVFRATGFRESASGKMLSGKCFGLASGAFVGMRKAGLTDWIIALRYLFRLGRLKRLNRVKGTKDLTDPGLGLSIEGPMKIS